MSLRETARGSHARRYTPLIAGTIGAALVLAGTSKYGPGVSMDLANYVSVARSLLAGRSYFLYDGSPLVMWPPLYPTLLAVPGILGIDPASAARYINALLSGAITFVAGRWLCRHINSPALLLASLAIVTLSYPLLLVSVFAMSEPPLVLITLLFLMVMERYSREGGTWSLIAAAALAALACLTRYAGVSLAFTGVIFLILRKEAAWRRKAADCLVFFVISILPLTAWLARNYLLYGSFTGERGPSAHTLRENLSFTLDTISAWMAPSSISAYVRVLLFLWLAALLFINLRRRKADLAPIKAPAIFLLANTGFLAMSLAAVAADRIDDRLLSPAYVPVVWVAFFMVDSLPRPVNNTTRRALGLTLAAVLGIWLVTSADRCLTAATEYARYGPGIYSDKAWINSELIRYMRDRRLKGCVYSNAPHALYIFAGIPARQSPRKCLPDSPGTKTADPEKFMSALARPGDNYLAWFDMMNSDNLYSVTELRSICRIRVLKALPDGTLYVVGGNGR